jgi:exonuclease III
MRGQAVPNYKKRKSKKVESNIDLATHNQTLKQLRQLNAGITTYLPILTLNVNGLNFPIKRQRLTNWIKKEDPTICCLQETHLIDRNKHRLRMKGWKNIYQANGTQKQAGVAILLSDKVDIKPTLIKQDKEGHSKLIQGEIDKMEITIISLHAPNVNAPNFIKIH